MLNTGNLFSGKRADPAAKQNSLRPIGAATTSTSSPVQAPDTATPPIKDSIAEETVATTPRAPVSIAGVQSAKLVVGPGVKLKGAEIQDCDALVVEGRVEATMDSRLIQIADQGSFDGKVNIDVAEIHGRFRGEMTAREQIIIHATGKVSGKIRYGRIVVHEGGELSGDVRSLTAEDGVVPASATTAVTAATDSETVDLGRFLAARGG
jgi:cytoskeletal protein CcmA (bactofilin family)